MNDREIYVDTKRQVVEYVRSVPLDQLDTMCTSCPAWSLRDVLAHHVHAIGLIVAGREIPQSARDAIAEPDPGRRSAAIASRDRWAEDGVASRRSLTLDELIGEWAEVEDRLTDDKGYLVLDLSVHFDDIRETLEGRRSREGADLARSLSLFHGMQRRRLQLANVDSVSLHCTDSGTIVGDPSHHVAAGQTYDLLRVIASRRSRHEADQLVMWGGTPESTIDRFAVYGWPNQG